MEIAAAALTAISGTVATVGSGIASAGSAIGGALGIGGTTAAASSLGGTAAAAAAASGGGSLFSALGGLSTVAGILSGGATIASVLAAQRAGNAEGNKLEYQAQDAETEVRVEEIKGLERRNSIKASLIQAIGERDVAAAASGVDLTFGTPVNARREAKEDAERAIGGDQATEDFRKARLRERAANYRIAASEARSGGLLKAATLAASGAADILRRG